MRQHGPARMRRAVQRQRMPHRLQLLPAAGGVGTTTVAAMTASRVPTRPPASLLHFAVMPVSRCLPSCQITVAALSTLVLHRDSRGPHMTSWIGPIFRRFQRTDRGIRLIYAGGAQVREHHSQQRAPCRQLRGRHMHTSCSQQPGCRPPRAVPRGRGALQPGECNSIRGPPPGQPLLSPRIAAVPQPFPM